MFRTKWKRQTSLGMELMVDPASSTPSTENCQTPDTFQSQALLQLYYQRLRSLPLLPLMFPAQHQYSAYLAALAGRAARSAAASPATSPVNLSSSPVNLSTSPVNLSLADSNPSPRSGSSNRSPASHRSRSTDSPPPRKMYCGGEGTSEQPLPPETGYLPDQEEKLIVAEDHEEKLITAEGHGEQLAP